MRDSVGRESAHVADDRDEAYYPQFSQSIRVEAEMMSAHYELFYCLEKSIRALVVERLDEEHGPNWWATQVPQSVADNVQKNIQGEKDAGLTPRSTEHVDYTTFGELGEIVRHNWDTFGDFLMDGGWSLPRRSMVVSALL